VVRLQLAVGEVPINTVPMVLKGLSVHGFPNGHSLDSGELLVLVWIHVTRDGS